MNLGMLCTNRKTSNAYATLMSRDFSAFCCCEGCKFSRSCEPAAITVADVNGGTGNFGTERCAGPRGRRRITSRAGVDDEMTRSLNIIKAVSSRRNFCPVPSTSPSRSGRHRSCCAHPCSGPREQTCNYKAPRPPREDIGFSY